MSRNNQVPIFIVSTGRCGSTLVSTLLKNHQDILSLFEFWPNRINLNELFSNKLYTGKEYWSLLEVPMAPDVYKVALELKTQVKKKSLCENKYIRRIALPMLVDDIEPLYAALNEYVCSLPPQQPKDHIVNIYSFLQAKLNKKIWVERTGANLDFLPYWKKMWPNMKLIHIYRDGRNCALSMSKHPAFKIQVMRILKMSDVNFYNIKYLDPDSFSIDDFINVKIDLCKYGELWNTMILKGLKELKEIPNKNLLSISYESLTKNPISELKRLIQFIDSDLEIDNWIKEQISALHSGRSNWSQLTLEEQERLTESCKEGLQKLNYI